MNFRDVISRAADQTLLIIERFGSGANEVPQAKPPVITTGWEVGKPNKSVFDYKSFGEDGYRQNVVIFSCVVIHSASICEPPIVVKRTSKGGTEEIIKDTLLHEILEQPNPDQDGTDWMEMLGTHYDVSGNAYAKKSRSAAGLPTRMDFLEPHKVDPIPDADGIVRAYNYYLGSSLAPERIDAADIIHFKNKPDPLNRYRGLSPIAVLSRQGELDNRIAEYMVALMTNSGIPAGILKKNEGIVTDEQREALKLQFRDRYAGRNAGKIMVLDSGYDYSTEGITPKQMDIQSVLTYTESRICSAYRIHPILVGVVAGIMNATYNNIETAKRLLWEDSMPPIFRKLKSKLTSHFSHEFGDDLSIDFDFSHIKSLNDIITEQGTFYLECYKNKTITQNEFRAKINMEPSEGGDEFKTDPVPMLPFGQQPPQDEQNPNSKDKNPAKQSAPGDKTPAKQLDKTGGADNKAAQKQKAKLSLITPSLERFDITLSEWRRLHSIADNATPAMRRAFLTAVAETLDGVNKGKVLDALAHDDLEAAMDAIPWDTMSESFQPEVEKQFKNILSRSAGAAMDFMPPSVIAVGLRFDVTNPRAVEWIEKYAGDLVAGIVDESKQAIRTIIKDGFTEGNSVHEMAADIYDHIGLTEGASQAALNYREELLGGLPENPSVEQLNDVANKVDTYRAQLLKNRATLIARTETIRASNQGQRELWNQAEEAGLIDKEKTQRVWIATDDEALCPICEDLDGETVQFDEEFSEGDPPAHPACRCAEGLIT